VVLALTARTPLAILADQKKRERFPLDCGKVGKRKEEMGERSVKRLANMQENGGYAFFGFYRRSTP